MDILYWKITNAFGLCMNVHQEAYVVSIHIRRCIAKFNYLQFVVWFLSDGIMMPIASFHIYVAVVVVSKLSVLFHIHKNANNFIFRCFYYNMGNRIGPPSVVCHIFDQRPLWGRMSKYWSVADDLMGYRKLRLLFGEICLKVFSFFFYKTRNFDSEE